MTTNLYSDFGTIQIDGNDYDVKFHGFEFKDKKGVLKKIQELVNKILNEGISAEEILSISARGVRLKSGKVFDLGDRWSEWVDGIEEGAIRLDPYSPDIPEPDLISEQAKVGFSFDRRAHSLDSIQFRKRDYGTLSGSDLARREVEFLAEKAGEKYDPLDGNCSDSTIGALMSSVPRKNYRMKIALKGSLRSFFGRSEMETLEVFGKNSPIANGGVTASYNRFADSVTGMRKGEAEDGSSDFYTGRVTSNETAEELARFLFLSEHQLYQSGRAKALAKGISFDPTTNTYEFRFAVQSLLTLMGGERKKIEEEIAEFKELSRSFVTIQDPRDSSKRYTVRMRPFPVATSNFNYMNTFEELLPDTITGKSFGDRLTRESDEALFAYARENMPADPESAQMIKDTIEQMGKDLKPWQKIMCRAFLCHLLKIPQVIHCKSSVDRTNGATPLIVAMKQWLRAKKEVPQVNGKFAIHEIVNVNIGTEEEPLFPFKELFAYSLVKFIKISELARFGRGLKLKLGLIQHRILHDLLPPRYLKKVEGNGRKTVLFRLALLFLVLSGIYPILAVGLFAYAIYKKTYGYGRDLLALPGSFAIAPFKAFWNAPRLFSPVEVDLELEEIRGRNLIKN